MINEMKGKMENAMELAKAAWQLIQNKTIEDTYYSIFLSAIYSMSNHIHY